MSLLRKALRAAINALRGNDQQIVVKHLNVPSRYLMRGVKVDVFLPPFYRRSNDKYPVLWFNDGQDMLALGMYDTLTRLYEQGATSKLIVVAIYSNEHRMDEYGVAGIPDYKHRGAKATEYTAFVLEELLPFLRSDFRLRTEATYNVFAGCSLGGLSAFDLVWSHPEVFGKVGAFSASFWWRSKVSTLDAPDANRIIPTLLEAGSKKAGLKFWFEVGTRDETDDRNGNGIIDSIDDTRDVINLLVAMGYRPHEDIEYTEVKDGDHNQGTWGAVMSDFLEWGFQ